jgi:N-acetylglucosamine-6-phosphate deacetylase
MIVQDVIDVHTHGTGLFDTRAGSATDIQSMAALYGQAGVTAILPTIYPGNIDEMRRNMAAVVEAMDVQGDGKEEVAKILGVHIEGPFLNPKLSGALDRQSFLEPTPDNLAEVLTGFRDIIKVMTIAPELDGALGVIERCAELGIRVSMGHSDATFEEAMEGKRAGAQAVTHLFNAMRPFHHRDPGLAGAGLLDEDLYVEIIPDGIHLAPETVEMVFRLKPKDKILLVSDSIKGPMYKDGVLQGSKMMLSRAVHTLRLTSIDPRVIRQAGGDNPKVYLGL